VVREAVEKKMKHQKPRRDRKDILHILKDVHDRGQVTGMFTMMGEEYMKRPRIRTLRYSFL
jgi:hypothetical protein